jgi:hypothetical protein
VIKLVSDLRQVSGFIQVFQFPPSIKLTAKPTIVQLAKGSVEEVQFKVHDRCLKLTSTLQGDRSVYLSFADDNEYSKWIRKAKKVINKG